MVRPPRATTTCVYPRGVLSLGGLMRWMCPLILFCASDGAATNTSSNNEKRIFICNFPSIFTLPCGDHGMLATVAANSNAHRGKLDRISPHLAAQHHRPAAVHDSRRVACGVRRLPAHSYRPRRPDCAD